MERLPCGFLLILFFLSLSYVSGRISFHAGEYCREELTIKPLAPKGSKTLVHFHFECEKELAKRNESLTSGGSGLEIPRHFSVFPRGLAQLVTETGVESFRLSLARGLWNIKWGEPSLADGTPVSSPQGAELQAMFRQTSHVPEKATRREASDLRQKRASSHEDESGIPDVGGGGSDVDEAWRRFEIPRFRSRVRHT